MGINQSPLQGTWQPFSTSNAAQKHFRREVKNSFSKYAHRKRMLCRKNHQDTFINICIFKQEALLSSLLIPGQCQNKALCEL